MSTNNGLYLLMFTLVITTIIIIFRLKKAIQGTKIDVKKTIIFSAYFVAISPPCANSIIDPCLSRTTVGYIYSNRVTFGM